MRKPFCQACSNERFGVKTRIAVEHTCEPQRIGYLLPDGGHATFSSPPDKEMWNAMNEMIQIAKKNLK